MRHTPNIDYAIKKAAHLHHGQTRRGELDPPYVTHLFSVAAILSEHTDDEEVLIAGLLHDALEDTAYTANEMQHDFGPRVTKIVEGVTIPEPPEGASEEWKKDRRAYIENLRSAPKESALISAADKIHNLRTAVHEYRNDPVAFWEDFGGTYEDRVKVYGAILDVISERLGSEHPMVATLESAFEQYKDFLAKGWKQEQNV